MKHDLIPSMIGGFGVGSCAGLGIKLNTPVRQKAHILSIELGKSCPLECRHCLYKGKGGEDPDQKVQNGIIEAIKNGLAPQWISISGKEPTAFPETLVALYKELKKSGAHIILMSNGVLIDNLLAAKLVDYVDSFDISLDGDKMAHEWMRGTGTYELTKNAIKNLIAHDAKMIGIISTAVNSILPDGRQQIDSIINLAKELASEHGRHGKVSLSVSLYYGQPNDPFLLNASQISYLINSLHLIDLPVLVLISAHYSHLWNDIAATVNFSLPEIGYDSDLCMPIMDIDNLRVLLPNQAKTKLFVFRVANDGRVYAGCNYLSWDESSTNKFSIGDMYSDSLEVIVQRFESGINPIWNKLAKTCLTCMRCSDWVSCQGGDKISGLYYNESARDPYCSKLNNNYS